VASDVYGRLRGEKVSDNVSRGQQAAEEVARRWIATMQTVADQIQRQQQTFQQMMQDQMSSYVQLLNTPPFYVSQQPQEEGQRATGQAFHQASEQWMQLAQRQQQVFQEMSQQWMEQAIAQQQAFQQVVQQSLTAYMDLFKPPR
jgi:plasmid stabilization system protein ParE